MSHGHFSFKGTRLPMALGVGVAAIGSIGARTTTPWEATADAPGIKAKPPFLSGSHVDNVPGEVRQAAISSTSSAPGSCPPWRDARLKSIMRNKATSATALDLR